MTPAIAAASTEPGTEGSPLALRSSSELQRVPPERPSAPPALPVPAASVTPASLTRYETVLPAAVAWPRSMVAAPPPELTWALASVALAAGVAWIFERRRRVQLEVAGDAGLWPTAPASRGRMPPPGIDETFPEGGEIAVAAQPVYVSVIGDTPSRREATLVDLHSLNARLQNLQRNPRAATELLEQHLVDFRYTSPWVFLELRELYRQLDQRAEWELVRDAFRTRFGQNAPQWDAASTAGDEIVDDRQLCGDLLRKWPQREARLFILRWMLGDAMSRQKNCGPPQLALGVYRDMLLLDSMLDEVMTAKQASPAAPAAPARQT